jgi:hypothetical protein
MLADSPSTKNAQTAIWSAELYLVLLASTYNIRIGITGFPGELLSDNSNSSWFVCSCIQKKEIGDGFS